MFRISRFVKTLNIKNRTVYKIIKVDYSRSEFKLQFAFFVSEAIRKIKADHFNSLFE
ncbi:MAG: hypothetical protein M3405_15035 [Acidobacteriota bacterium]|nr:hypothetical protein [Acidobacteriota bacterium]